MERLIEPEWLDVLPADDPRARHSRGDLRRINWFMNNVSLVARTLKDLPIPKRVLDVGAGDGTFALAIAERLAWKGTEIILVDRAGELPGSIRERFAAANCRVEFHRADALDGLEEIGPVDVTWVNLFLHHFDDFQLRRLLAEILRHSQTFIACEPRRSAFALLASRCLALIGCNSVTRHDAVVSVRAGFNNEELSRLWPEPSQWSLSEGAAGLFSHLFVARRL
jgi:SAM-dependent methyltransferase